MEKINRVFKIGDKWGGIEETETLYQYDTILRFNRLALFRIIDQPNLPENGDLIILTSGYKALALLHVDEVTSLDAEVNRTLVEQLDNYIPHDESSVYLVLRGLFIELPESERFNYPVQKGVHMARGEYDAKARNIWERITKLERLIIDHSPIFTGEVAAENPRDFVSLSSRGSCGVHGRQVLIVNRHNSQKIHATVRTKWLYQNEARSRTTTYALEPGAEAYVGCTIPGPTGQRFDMDITGARFA